MRFLEISAYELMAFGNGSAIYDDDGEMVWSTATGRRGKAVYA